MLAIITDSTCDIREEEIKSLNVKRVPLYVNFDGELYKDWLEISPKELIKRVSEGDEIPGTSQPTPIDFGNAYKEAVAEGATEILVLTISSLLSGTFQSANLATEGIEVPVTVFDSKAASLGLGAMVKKAVRMRDAGESLEKIIASLEKLKESNYLIFTVKNLDFLQKNGRIGGAAAMLGGLLNIKPLLGVVAGKVDSLGRARGEKKAFKEIVKRIKQYRDSHQGKMFISFLHIQKPEAADNLRQAVLDAGIDFEDQGSYEIGTVIACHVGPGVYGAYMNIDQD
ncbi:MAG TPA: DegV family protein [Trueperaceae bacterium]|nr:DegV family protein [Trueperaceae bacterium]